MKKELRRTRVFFTVILSVLLLTGSLSGCAFGVPVSGGSAGTKQGNEGDAGEAAESPEDVNEAALHEVVVFAAASLTETLTEAADKYMEKNPDVSIVCNFDSSGTLKTQIAEGADCDLFISAATKQMDELDITASPEVNTEGLDIADSSTRIDLLKNRVVLAVPEGNPAGINSFEQLRELLESGDILLAVGNADVPVGQYTGRIFEYLGITESEVADRLTYGSNVKEVMAFIQEGSADCGIIYATDAFSAGLTAVDEATEEMCGGMVIYPAAVLKSAGEPEEAGKFLDYLKTGECAEIFSSVGFSPLYGQ
ncbi:MAG TPA: molybdate ABC transporter substrate-binding protein [Lachnospiraceae bacterium]|nr:molybdate ABC transporter substrate-binding protein [Lachnospiraceae bacterium]